MKKIIIAVIGLASCLSLCAQVTIKKDLTQYFSQLPAPPSSLQDAYQHCQCLGRNGQVMDTASLTSGLHTGLLSDAQSMGTLTNTQAQQAQQAMALGNQIQADNVNGMTKDQQLTWVQNNMQNQGNAAGMASFAQKMRDPAEAARFKAMTPAQKMAYMQQAGVDPSKNVAIPTTSTNPQVNIALAKQKQMTADATTPQAQQLTGTLNGLLDPTGTVNPATAQQRLTQMGTAYSALKTLYQNADTAYQTSLQTAGYGYTGDAGQDFNVNHLAAGQQQILIQVSQLEGYLDKIYQFGANAQATILKTGK